MPYGKGISSYPATSPDQKRKAASRVSYLQKGIQPYKGPGEGKFGGLPGGPSGGSMNTGGKRRAGNKLR